MSAKKIDFNDPQLKFRKCLGCTFDFLSSWSGNRICDVCKGTWDYKQQSKVAENVAEVHIVPPGQRSS